MLVKQTHLLYKVLNKQLDRSVNFAIVNTLLVWSIFIVLTIVLTRSVYFSAIQEILNLLWNKIVYYE